jgi:hypothetical protein
MLENKQHKWFPNLPASADDNHIGSSRWIRDEIAIVEGRKSFTPDKTTAKGPVNLGPDANSVLPKNRI